MSPHIKKSLAVLVVIIALVGFGVTFWHAALFAPQDDNYALPGFGNASSSNASSSAGAVVLPPASDTSQPVRLIIPSLSINANVQYVGVTKTGALGVPNNFTDVAWYKYGTVPGQVGSAVMDGHVDNAISLPGVFKHLDQIKVGDDVEVETASSTTLHFVVTDVESYQYQNLPLERIFNTSGGEYLTLITCGGTWDEVVKSYDHRLVVYTKFIN